MRERSEPLAHFVIGSLSRPLAYTPPSGGLSQGVTKRAFATPILFAPRRFHQRKLRVRPLFAIDNGGSKPLGPQIDRVAKRIKGL